MRRAVEQEPADERVAERERQRAQRGVHGRARRHAEGRASPDPVRAEDGEREHADDSQGDVQQRDEAHDEESEQSERIREQRVARLERPAERAPRELDDGEPADQTTKTNAAPSAAWKEIGARSSLISCKVVRRRLFPKKPGLA